MTGDAESCRSGADFDCPSPSLVLMFDRPLMTEIEQQLSSIMAVVGLRPSCGFFAVAKTGMPIPGARRRAWSLRDCRRAATFQATLALRASLVGSPSSVVWWGVWVAVSTHRITSFSPSRSARARGANWRPSVVFKP